MVQRVERTGVIFIEPPVGGSVRVRGAIRHSRIAGVFIRASFELRVDSAKVRG